MKSPHELKESIFIVEEVTAKEASKDRPRIQKKDEEANEWIETMDDKNATEGHETGERSSFGKNRQLFIHKEGKNY